MNIFITGGAGFIGSHIAHHHLKKGDNVEVIDDLSTGNITNILPFKSYKNFAFYQANLLTWPALIRTIIKADVIYHMAADVGVFHVLNKPLQVLKTNIFGTQQVLEAVLNSGQKPRVFIASSSSVYGHSKNKILSEKDSLVVNSTHHPLCSYAISKMANEVEGLAFYQSHGIPITLLRIFNTVGPRQTGRYGMVVPRFIAQACAHEPITIYGDGNQTRSFCDVRDIVAMIDILIDTPDSVGEILNIGNDQEITINKLAKLIRQLTNSQSPIKYIAYNEAYGQAFIDIPHRRPDLSKLLSLTKFKHRWPLEKTLENLIYLHLSKEHIAHTTHI